MPGTSPSVWTAPPPEPGPYTDVRGQRGPQGIGGGNVELMRGLVGLVKTNEATLQELKGIGQQMTILNERTFRMNGGRSAIGGMSQQDFILAVREGTTQALVSTAASLVTAMQGMSGGGSGATLAPAVPGVPQPTPEGGGGTATPPPSHGDPNAPEARPLTNYERYQQGRDVGAMRQAMAKNVQNRLAKSRWAGEELTEVAEGVFHRPNGTVATAGEVAQHLRRSRIMGAVSGAATEVAEGGSLGGAAMNLLPKGLGGALGFGAAAYTAVNKGLDFAESQREKNAEWQSILGGSNAEGFRERFRERMFSLGQRGIMSGANAEALYRGVAETGRRGESARRAQDFGTDAYRRFGMSVQESVHLIDIATREGADSLTFLTTSLQGVTKAAREAGINAQVMRQQFTAAFEGNIGSAGVTGAATIAGAQTQANASFGRTIGQQINTTGQTSDQASLRIQAARSGLTLGQLVVQRNRNPTAYLQGANADRVTVARQILRPLGERMVREAIALNNGQPLSPEQFEQLALRYMSTPGSADPIAAVQMVASRLKITNLTEMTVFPFLMQVLAGRSTQGSTNPAVIAAQREAELGMRQTAPGDEANVRRASDLAGGSGTQPSVMTNTFNDQLNWQRSNRQEQAHAQRILAEQVRKTGRGGGVSSALVKDFQGDRRIRVKTVNGDRIVTTDDALRYYRDQVDAGTAVIESGPGAGKTVAEALNIAGDKNLKVTSEKATNLGTHGRAADEGSRNQGGKITVTATPRLEQWLRFMDGGQDPSAGNSPPGSRTTAAGLPSDSSRG